MIEVRNKIDSMNLQVQKKFNIFVDPFIVYDMKSVRILGQYDINENVIHLDEELLDEFKKIYIHEVVIHEYAHAVVYHLYERDVRPHGREFKTICSFLGLENSRASINVFKNSRIIDQRRKRRNRNNKKFFYKCKCKGKYHELSQWMHKNITENGVKYRCKKCGKKLKFAKKKTQLNKHH